MAGEMGVAYLGGIELDPRLGQCCDSGKSFISEFPDSRVSKAYQQIVNGKWPRVYTRCWDYAMLLLNIF